MINIVQGNCIDKIKELDDNSIDCVVSSPPYYGLRDYGVNGQFGLEKTYQEYIANTVKVFETFKPKLKDTATIWWNVGDTYSSTRWSNTPSTTGISQKHSDIVLKKIIDIPEKSLMMIPNRVAIALQIAGWYIRSEIIWHKPNPMPESVRDRPTSCHEKIWLITKNKKYYYDADAIKEPLAVSSIPRLNQNIKNQKGSARANAGRKTNGNLKAVGNLEKRNKRNVWTITTKPFKEAHFATFPPDLIEPCIKGGCPEKVCVKCGNPQIKEFYRKEKYNPGYGNQHTPKGTHKKIGGVYQKWLEENPPEIRLKASCDCNADFKSGVVLDPFAGAGTTGIVARSLNRTAILIELNPEYIEISKNRIDKEFGMFK